MGNNKKCREHLDVELEDVQKNSRKNDYKEHLDVELEDLQK